jgi:putative glycerol-1-phosphate prenyltransferase
MKEPVLHQFKQSKNAIAVLIDPEKCDNGTHTLDLLEKSKFAGVDFIFIGGSTVTRKEFNATIHFIKSNTSIPVIIFPGSSQQISEKADAILYLSLLSGRNPDFLIGHHVQSAAELFEMELEIIPTAYLLIDGGTQSSVAYVSQTTPIPRDNSTIIRNTAIAGKLQGKQLLYLDAGSGARFSVPAERIKELTTIDLPIIVGGGITTIEQIEELHQAGTNIVVIGNKLEQDTDFLLDIYAYKKVDQSKLTIEE